MEKEIKIFVVGGDTVYANWLYNYVLVDDIKDADIVLFTGGEDVDPSMYNREKHPTTYSNIKRDRRELEIFKQIDPKKQIAVGICRGSQFLCILNGGILVQNCDNHALGCTHTITNGDKLVEITSTHHQMQYPFNLDSSNYDLLYWSSLRRSRKYEGDGIEYVPKEPEIVKYHVKENPICLAIQGHPEFMRKESPVIEILNNLVNQCLQDVQ